MKDIPAWIKPDATATLVTATDPRYFFPRGTTVTIKGVPDYETRTVVIAANGTRTIASVDHLKEK